jgi:hypothetical protein
MYRVCSALSLLLLFNDYVVSLEEERTWIWILIRYYVR